jgi:regulator of sigma E protease
MDSILGVLKFIGILFEVVLIFNLLIIVHELGHFLAAKWRGLYIEGFGIWFGKPIWKKKIGGVTYSLGSIPAGGFVKLPQLAPMETLEGQTEIPRDQLKPISALDKIIVAFAGPLFSFLLAVVFAFLVHQIGRPMGEQESSVHIGALDPGSPAEKAGLKAGDKIVEIDGQQVSRFVGQSDDAILWRVVRSEGETISVVVERDGNRIEPFHIKPNIPATNLWERRGTRQIGITPSLTPLVWEVLPSGVGADSGLQKGDFITHINGERIYSPSGIWDYAQAHPGQEYTITVERKGAPVTLPFKPRRVVCGTPMKDGPADKAGLKAGDQVISVDGRPFVSASALVGFIRSKATEPLEFVLERDGKQIDPIRVTPALNADTKKPMIGMSFDEQAGLLFDQYGRGETRYPGVAEQIKLSVGAIVNTLGAVTSRKSDVSVQHMGGPVMMMRIYYVLFEQPEGWKLALWFSVLLNVNLALLNMLPLPVLDGGHITLALVEAARRKPVNVKLLEWIQTACAMLIIGFMLFVTFFDVQDLFGEKDRNKFRYSTPAAETK